jgi:hypothetical protein
LFLYKKHKATIPDKSYFVTSTTVEWIDEFTNNKLMRTNTTHTSPSFISARAGFFIIIFVYILFSGCQYEKENYKFANFKLENVVLIDSVSGNLDCLFVSKKKDKLELIKAYYGNGNLRAINYYLIGKLHGEFKMYFENKNLMYNGNYFYGLKIGVHQYYFENGKIKFEEIYNTKGELINRKDYFD